MIQIKNSMVLLGCALLSEGTLAGEPKLSGATSFHWQGEIPSISASPQYWIVTPAGDLLGNTNIQGGMMVLTHDSDGVQLASAVAHSFKVVSTPDQFGEYNPSLAKDVDYQISLRFIKTGINGMFNFGGRDYFIISANGKELDSHQKPYSKGDYAIVSVDKMDGATSIEGVDDFDSIQIQASVAIEVNEL